MLPEESQLHLQLPLEREPHKQYKVAENSPDRHADGARDQRDVSVEFMGVLEDDVEEDKPPDAVGERPDDAHHKEGLVGQPALPQSQMLQPLDDVLDTEGVRPAELPAALSPGRCHIYDVGDETECGDGDYEEDEAGVDDELHFLVRIAPVVDEVVEEVYHDEDDEEDLPDHGQHGASVVVPS